MKKQPFITLDNVTVRLRTRRFLENSRWRINADENWAILGPNGAGKTTLAGALCGRIPVVAGKIIRHFLPVDNSSPDAGMIGYMSFELHRQILKNESRKEEFRSFSGNLHDQTTVTDLILSDRKGDHKSRFDHAVRLTGVKQLLDKDFRSLSAGEIRKVLITRTLINNPRLLILDEPFDGLDRTARKSIGTLIDRLVRKGHRVILITQRIEEIVDGISHILFLKKGKVFKLGEKTDMLKPDIVRDVFDGKQDLYHGALANNHSLTLNDPIRFQKNDTRRLQTLIKMEDVTIQYGKTIVLNRISWEVKPQQNWILLGSNGAGKSTLLKLISGDNTQAYANRISLFGRKKGSGESIWDIKKYIGIVSPDLQARYPDTCKVFDVICSGFFDTLGLYRRCHSEQIAIAEKWINLLELDDLTGKSFGWISHGQRQLVLMGRAMVKSPMLLLLDDPCDGLDMSNRGKVLQTLEFIGSRTDTSLVYTTHHREEIVPSTTHIMQLDKGRIKTIVDNLPQKGFTIR